MRPAIFGAMIVTCLAGTIAAGRGIQHYSYEELFKQADVIVFACPLKTEKTTDKWEEGRQKFTGQNTTLIVKHTLKGRIDGEQIRVLHFEEVREEGSPGVLNGPLLINFKINPRLAEADFGPEYLLFLKQTKDGRYEPVSGRYDPVLSIKEISEPKAVSPDGPKPAKTQPHEGQRRQIR